jgi:glycosyltransferase involved in cell wall biosynthesis
MPTRRILFIIPTLVRGGAEKQLSLLATGLDHHEFDVHVCALTAGGPWATELADKEIPLTVIGKRGKIDPIAYLRLRQLIKRLRPEIVHTWLFAANSYGRAAAISAGVPTIIASERCADRWKRWHELAMDRRLARRTHAIVANSQGVVDFYRERGIPTHKFRVIPNGISPARPSALTRSQVLDEFRIPETGKIVGSMSRLWPQKCIRDVIWATDHLKVFRDDVYLLLLGDGPLRASLERYADQIEIRDKVRFLGIRDDVPELLPHMDVVVSASAYEGLSNSLMEALAAGVPVVATDIPGHRELVRNGETGFLARPGSVADLANLINQLLKDPDLAQRMGNAGKALMATDFSVEKMVTRHEDLYRDDLEPSLWRW